MQSTSSTSLTLYQLAALYNAHALKHYRRRSGELTREHVKLRTAIARLINFTVNQQHTAAPSRLLAPVQPCRHRRREEWMSQDFPTVGATSMFTVSLSRNRSAVTIGRRSGHSRIRSRAEIGVNAVGASEDFTAPTVRPPRRVRGESQRHRSRGVVVGVRSLS